MADGRNLFFVPLLAALAQRWRNRAFVVPDLLPQVPVGNRLFYYPKFGDDLVYSIQPDEYGVDASVNIVDVSSSKATGVLKDRGLGAYVDQSEVDQAGGVIPAKAWKVEEVMKALTLALENRVAKTLRDRTVCTANDSPSTKWTDANSDPKKYVLEKKRAMKLAPNVMVVSGSVHDALQIHPKVLDAIKYTRPATDVTIPEMAAYFGVEKYLVGEALYNTAKKGQATSLSQLWGKDVLLARVATGPVTPMMSEPSLGYIPRLGQPPPSDAKVAFDAAKGMWRVYEAPPDPRRGTGEGSIFVKVESTYEPLINAPAELAFLIYDAIA